MSEPTLQRSFRGHKDGVTGVVFNPNMKQIISSSLDSSLMLWNFKPTMRAFKFTEHEGPVNAVAMSSKGTILASASKDRTVRLWSPSVAKSKPIVVKMHTAGVRGVSFSDDSSTIISASDDKTIKLWSVVGQKFKATLSGHRNWVRCARGSRDGNMILSGSDDNTVRLWSVQEKSAVYTFQDHTAPVNDVAFHPNGMCFASCSADNSIKICDIRSTKLLQHYTVCLLPSNHKIIETTQAHVGSVNSISFHPSGDYLLSGSSDMTVKIWDLKEGHLFFTLHGHVGAVSAVTFSPDGEYFGTGGADAQVMVWKTNFTSSPLPSTDMEAAVLNTSRRSHSRGKTRRDNWAELGMSVLHAPPPLPTTMFSSTDDHLPPQVPDRDEESEEDPSFANSLLRGSLTSAHASSLSPPHPAPLSHTPPPSSPPPSSDAVFVTQQQTQSPSDPRQEQGWKGSSVETAVLLDMMGRMMHKLDSLALHCESNDARIAAMERHIALKKQEEE